MKTCTKCGAEKELSEFGKQLKGKFGHASWCKACDRKGMQDAYNADPEKFCKRSRDWRKKNPEKAIAISRKCHKQKDRFVVALQSSRKAARNGGYVSCIATLEEIKGAHAGRCFICGVPEIECSRKLVMDHCHETGEFRGWLCRKCNSALGFFRDNEELLVDALHYLMKGEVR